MVYFDKDFIRFFKDLAPNNNKDWFDLNRERYETKVREPFKAFVQQMIDLIAADHPEFKGLEPKDCIFRINRDIRFSKDKTPYKLMVSAVIAPEGKKSKAINGVYFELTPEHVRVYGGVYEVDKDDVLLIREGIAKKMKEFKKISQDKKFREMYGEIHGEKNKVLPADLKEAAIEEPLIYNKQWYFYTQFKPSVILHDDLDKLILNCFRVGKPMEDFFNELIKR